MKIIKSFFKQSVKIIKVTKYNDNRGYFSENYNFNKLKKLGISEKFVQDNYSFSKNSNVIRGLHFQKPNKDQSKLISVIKGSILDIFVDIRKNSKTYGKYQSYKLNENDFKLIYIPSGFAHGFRVTSKNTLVIYKTSNFYSPKHEQTIRYNDTNLKINWGSVRNIITSQKDKNGIIFNEFKTPINE